MERVLDAVSIRSCLFIKVAKVPKSELEEHPYMNLGELVAVDLVAFAYQIGSGMVIVVVIIVTVIYKI